VSILADIAIVVGVIVAIGALGCAVDWLMTRGEHRSGELG